MTKLTQNYYKMFILDELSTKNTAIHRINPVIKLLVTLSYLLIVVSYGKYEVAGLIPMVLYPLVVASAGDIPFRPMLGGLLIAAPLVIGIGIFNPLLDTQIVFSLGAVNISSGMISFAALLLKCSLTVLAALLLISTTGINKIAAALHKLHIPDIFIIQLLLTYRYLSVLLGEASRTSAAYSLRAPNQRGIDSKAWGSLLGQLLLRTYDRAQRVYQGMKLRGFDSHYYGANMEAAKAADWLYLFGWLLFFAAVRLYNIPMLLGYLITGVIR